MRQDFFKYILVIFLVIFVCSCSDVLTVKQAEEPLAKVDEKSLYLSDILKVMPGSTRGEDSVKFVDNYADKWVRTQLKLTEAENLLQGDLTEIDRMVEDYRLSLLNFKIEQSWVDEQIDSLAKQDNIAQYYSNHIEKFVMNIPLVKGTIIKLPDSYRQQMKLFALLGTNTESAKLDYIDICVKNNFELYEFSTWTPLTDFIAVLPTVKGRNYEYLLKKVRKVQEMSDANSKYFLYISNFLNRGNHAPIETVSTEISRILYNQHKQNIINQREKELYNSALLEQRILLPSQEKEN